MNILALRGLILGVGGRMLFGTEEGKRFRPPPAQPAAEQRGAWVGSNENTLRVAKNVTLDMAKLANTRKTKGVSVKGNDIILDPAQIGGGRLWKTKSSA
jgi:hypothetical protein